MPANLPPQYFEVEKRFRSAKDTADKIELLEEMLAIMPKHKGTDHLRAELRTRIAKLNQTLGKKAAIHRASMLIEKEGAAQIMVIGPTNAGKSQLVASITNASPIVAEYPFTTHQPTPGMMEFENIKIQLIDTPPLVPQYIEPWFRHMLIRANALLVVIDANDTPLNQMEATIKQLKSLRMRLDKMKDEEDEDIILYDKKALIVANKIDLPKARQNYIELRRQYHDQLPVVAISAKEGNGLENMKSEIYQILNIIRVYTKTPGNKPDFDDPIILEKGSTLEDAAADVHKDFLAKLKYARVWGSGKHDGVMVKRDHILQDGDIIELHL